MDELQYIGGFDKHRAISKNELIKLISQSKGLTVYTLNDILNNLTSKKVKSLVDSGMINSEVMRGITAGRSPQVVTTKGKPDVQQVTNMMILGYCMWYLRQMGLLTGGVSLGNEELSTTAVVDSDEPFSQPELVLAIRLMFWQDVLDKRVHDAHTAGYLPIVVCQSWQELSNTYNQLSEAAKSQGVLAIYVRQQQNAKFLSAYWLRQDGAILLDNSEKDKLVEIYKQLHAHQDDRRLKEVMQSYDRSKQLAQMHLPSLRKNAGEP